MLSNLASKLGLTSSSSSSSFVIKPRNPSKMEDLPRQVKYTSSDVVIPDSFLTTPPAAPITSHHIDFASSPLPQYEGHTALILDNVLSPQECRELLSLAEASVPRPEGSSAWRPALVNLGAGWEAPAPGYRESDRIIWDQQTIVDRLWERCAQAEGLRELLAVIPPDPYMRGGKWKFSRFNERMRYLKYTPGQYFKRKPASHSSLPYISNRDQLIAMAPTTTLKAKASSMRPFTLSTSTSTTQRNTTLSRILKAARPLF